MASNASRSTASPSASASSTVLSTSTIPTSVESKQDDFPTVRFTNVQHLFDVINCTTGDFLAVTHVSPNNFAKIERERDKRRRKFRFRRYSSTSQILHITIPTYLSETLHLEFNALYQKKTDRMGVWNNWRTIGAATRRAQGGHPGGDSGEGDSTGGPRPERGFAGNWPTLVQIVLLAKFEHTSRATILEKWEEEARSTRPGATTTRHAAAPCPVLRQTITITRDTTTDPVSYNVRGALVFGFRLLFLRDPGPGEGDFVFSVQELEHYAEVVWEQVED
ncbi:hypothetical protein C8A00DRAFT_41044 [Chaetomidium leptoderma]|uniref:Uncharacterized protein n=1 Tax=Chaetomidium leptoderma TaxID=669021 RepID=A0AAN6VRI5_9PEZI|nr:hypothetical protein C8A00DRAFT_41044 [Chaetomidium leptoderma]